MKWTKRADDPVRVPAAGSAVDGDDFDDADALHLCSWCGRILEGDPEDELNGEGPGRDICGNCNRTKNWEAIEMGM
jgi:hypothetical protein